MSIFAVQSGKSSLFDLLINDLMQSAVDPKSILRLNLDEPVFTAYWDNPSDLYALIEASEVLTGVKVQYLFLDEVQQVKEWELFAKGAYDTKRFKKIYITGSASDLLDNRFASLLSGRYFANVVRPFSMRERLKISGFTNLFSLQTRRPEAIRVMNDYLQWGGFPETVLHEMTDDVKTELLQSYYDSIVLKDCVAYSRIRDTELFYRLLHFLLTNVGNIFNYSSLARSLSSNENTVRNYLSYASRSYVLADVTNFSWSLKTGSRAEHKAYCIDNGLMNAISFRFSSQKGALLENAVYNELCNKGYADITFVKNNRECDFVARKDGCFHAFQVCSELMDQNSLREQQGFKCLTGVTETASYTIITFNQHEEIDGVQVLPFYVWAMKG